MQASTTDLAMVLGITDRRIQQLEKVGVFRRLSHGEWDLADSVQSYLRHRLQSETQRRSRVPAGKAEEKLKAAKAEREQLKLARERLELIPTGEAIAIIDEALGMIRAGLAGVPARITREMTLRDRIETEIDAVLGTAADRFTERAAAVEPAGEPDPAAAEDDPGSVGGEEPELSAE